MKRNTLSFIAILFMAFVAPSIVVADNITVPLTVGYFDPTIGQDNPHKGPVQIPEVSLDDHTLYFFTPCDGYTLNLVDENDVVVYTQVIPTGTTSLVLPSDLFGEFELQIICGNYCFWGYICIS